MSEIKNTQIPTDFFISKNATGEVKIEIYVFNETIWLTQDKIARLFGVDRVVITKNLKNIFQMSDIQELAVIAIFALTAADGKKYQTKLYNLDAILSIGYRVNSIQAMQFRIWANSVLKEYWVKEFVMNDDRLKNPQTSFGKDDFEDQLARIRDIRSSERRFYQKITDIYSQCSADYEANSDVSKKLFAIVQNKLYRATSGQTAGEVIVARVDTEKTNMGLTNRKNPLNGIISRPDASIAKNYLNEIELDNLNHTVSMYLDYAEERTGNVYERLGDKARCILAIHWRNCIAA